MFAMRRSCRARSRMRSMGGSSTKAEIHRYEGRSRRFGCGPKNGPGHTGLGTTVVLPRLRTRADGSGEASTWHRSASSSRFTDCSSVSASRVVVAGFARLLKTRPKVRPGWLVPLLGIFIMLDVTSFWNGAWRAREWMVPEYGHLFLGLVVTALYYFAAHRRYARGCPYHASTTENSRGVSAVLMLGM